MSSSATADERLAQAAGAPGRQDGPEHKRVAPLGR